MLTGLFRDNVSKLPWHRRTVDSYDSVVVEAKDKGPLTAGISREGAVRDVCLRLFVRFDLGKIETYLQMMRLKR